MHLPKLLVLVGLGLLVAVGTPASSAAAAAAAATDGSADYAAIDRYVESEMRAQRIPGLALGIVRGNRITHLKGFGEADPAGRAVTPQTPFFIGSLTKSFTALAIMQLSEVGRVQLDAPVQRYLPWWRVADVDASARITVRHLLYQVSGLSKATGNEYATSGETHDSALEDRVRALRTVELTQPVGKTWQYSNANYWTLGTIVQAVSGQSYETYVQEHIFDPLQMRNSFTSQSEATQHGLPIGHRYWFGFPFAAELPFDRGSLGAGGISASAEDMARYLSVYLNDGRYGDTALVSREGAAELQRAGVPTGQEGISYAMGWDVRQVHGAPAVSHDGSVFHSHANVSLLPGSDWGVIVMENAENSPDEFFGSRRMTGIADGVTGMLIGRQPEPTATSAGLWIAYGAVFGVIALQIAGKARTARTMRRWRAAPNQRPSGGLQIGLHIGLPLLLSWLWAAIVLVGLPRLIKAPLSAIQMGLPDLGYLLVGSAVVALAWSFIRVVWATRVLLDRRSSAASSDAGEGEGEGGRTIPEPPHSSRPSPTTV